MQIDLDFEKQTCTVKRESSDPKYYGARGAVGESKLFYHIKQKLNQQGYDLIKKRMCKDGHLMDELQQYIRSRKINPDSKPFCIYNTSWAIEGAEKPFNDGVVCLRIEWL